MKSLAQVVAVSAIIILIAGCDAAHEQSGSMQEAAAEQNAAAAAAPEAKAKQERDRKFIRTSDMRFRVKDVAAATYRIEDVTRQLGGFVTYTHLESTIDEKKTARISRDSALETVHYTVVNSMTLRVPNQQLDSTLKAVAALVDYLDYRTIKADDVALQIKANQKTMQRAVHNGHRLRRAIDDRGRKLGETAEAEGLAVDRQKEADDAEIANLSLEDQVNYSTVSLELYQRAETKHWIVPNDTDIDDFRPGLGWRIWDSLKTGWRIVEELLVLITQLWLLLLLGLTGWFLYRRYRPRKLSLK